MMHIHHGHSISLHRQCFYCLVRPWNLINDFIFAYWNTRHYNYITIIIFFLHFTYHLLIYIIRFIHIYEHNKCNIIWPKCVLIIITRTIRARFLIWIERSVKFLFTIIYRRDGEPMMTRAKFQWYAKKLESI